MMRELVLTTTALADFDEIGWFVAEGSGSRAVADDFVERLISRCERLAELSGTFGTARPELLPGLRSTPHKGYIIFFRHTDDAVEIVNVLRTSRDLLDYFGDE